MKTPVIWLWDQEHCWTYVYKLHLGVFCFCPEPKPALEERGWHVTPQLKSHKPRKRDAGNLAGQWVALPAMEGNYNKVVALTRGKHEVVSLCQMWAFCSSHSGFQLNRKTSSSASLERKAACACMSGTKYLSLSKRIHDPTLFIHWDGCSLSIPITRTIDINRGCPQNYYYSHCSSTCIELWTFINVITLHDTFRRVRASK